MTGAISQYERAVRMLARIERPAERSLEDYEDECWCFFQNCWHLKDWIKYDNGVEPRYREMVEADVGDIREIRICADLANRSKHLKVVRTVREETNERSAKRQESPTRTPSSMWVNLAQVTVNTNSEYSLVMAPSSMRWMLPGPRSPDKGTC